MASWIDNLLHDPTYLVFAGSSIATFVALVLAEENQARLKNGLFGTAAGSAVGGLVGLYKSNPLLLVVGFVGSALGGLLGWLVHLALSIAAGSRVFRPLLEYQFGGITSVRQRLLLDEQELLLSALREWRTSFNRLCLAEKQLMLDLAPSLESNRLREQAIYGWLASFVDVYGLVFDMIAAKREYRSRVTLIIFGRTVGGDPVGRHWVHYSGPLPAHKVTKDFAEDSIGYRVLIEQYPSPYFSDPSKAA